MLFAKENDASVASFFIVAVAKALDKLLPEKHKVIGAEIAHNPSKDIGMPNTHCDILSHVHIDYERELLKKDMDMLGTITRSQIILQIDPSVSNYQLRQRFSFYDDIDRVTGLKNKRELIESVSTSIKGVLDADRKKLIMMNVSEGDLDKVKEVMPSMGGLTISEVLSDEKTVAVQAVIDEKQVFELVNDLRNAGARDILVVPIERII
jgi:ATP phosphoribosyltransferase-like protein